jgi:hypothetical protein
VPVLDFRDRNRLSIRKKIETSQAERGWEFLPLMEQKRKNSLPNSLNLVK